jgi:hypothetical protein
MSSSENVGGMWKLALSAAVLLDVDADTKA